MPKPSKPTTKAPTVLDLFCGAGGMSLGFQNVGCEILGGIDKHLHAIRTHHSNFPNCKLKLDAQPIESLINLSQLDIQPGEVDILIGGSPCQVFSLVGKGKMRSLGKQIESDIINFLYEQFIRFVEYYKPLFFVIENVNHLRNHWIFPTLIGDLEKGLHKTNCNYPGYNISSQILIASDYGVPQIRKRLFIVGRRKDANLDFKFPEVNTTSPISVGEAIRHLQKFSKPFPCWFLAACPLKGRQPETNENIRVRLYCRQNRDDFLGNTVSFLSTTFPVFSY